MNSKSLIFPAFLVILVFINTKLICQTSVPEILHKGTIPEQMNYLEEKTRIYEDYRAIREDMFQLVKKNVADSLLKDRNKINELTALKNGLNTRIDSLNESLTDTKNTLKETTRTKNSISVIGIELNKVTYNSIIIIIIGSLIFLLVTGFLIFKRNMVVTLNTKEELAELKVQFEEYRTKTRLDREKASMDHFNEIKKLKGR
jgi:hypothetical protein